jgi:hypothetical protein
MIEQILVNRLRGGLTGVGVDWGYSPQGFVPPRVVLTLVSGIQGYEHGGVVTDLRQARVQIDCYALGADAVVALKGQVLALTSGWIDRAQGVLGCFVTAERDFEAGTEGVDQVSRRIIEIMAHYKES